MAKNDKNKMQNQVNSQVGRAQTSQDNMMNNYLNPAAQGFKDNYDKAVPMQMEDYRNIMNSYKSYADGLPANNRISAERVSYNRSSEMDKALQGYSSFADNGGYSPDDVTNLRSRALSPVQSVYNNMRNEMARQKNVQGGYAPNMAASMTRMRSGTSQQMSDILQQVNGHIAEMQQQGKLAGLSGLGQLSAADTEFGQQAQYHNQDAALTAARSNQIYGAYDPRLQALQGMSSLYSAQPGMSAMFGNQLLAGNQQLLQGNQQQQQIGQMGINGQQMVANMPSNFETALGRVGQIGSMVGNIAAPFFGNKQASGGMRQPNASPIRSAYNPVGQVSYPPSSINF